MHDAKFQGVHYRYAEAGEEMLIERLHLGHFHLWLRCSGGHKLIHSSLHSRFRGLQTVGDVFPDGKIGSIPTQ